MSQIIVNPFPYAPLWTPEEIDTEGWWDASDASTITESGGAVSQWDDKSGNGRHAVQATGANQPTTGTRQIGSNNALDFVSPQFMGTSYAGFNSRAARSVFGVCKYDVDISGGAFCAFDHISTARWFLDNPGTSGLLRFSLGSSNPLVSGTVDTNPTQYGATSAGGATSIAGNFYRDGTSEGSGVAATMADLTDNFLIGSGETETGGFDGLVGEVVIVSGVVSAATRQLIEGYLAWKWGLQANLPASHPFKSNPPRILRQAWTPDLLDNQEYWYDAADGDTITESGGSVSQWDDKSPNGYDLTQATGANQPSWGTRKIGGRNALDFNGTTSRLSSTTQPPSDVRSAVWLVHNDNVANKDSDAEILISARGGDRTIGFAFGDSTSALLDEVISEYDEDTPAEYIDRQGISDTNLPSLTIDDHILSFVRQASGSGDWFMGTDGSSDLRDLTSGTRRDWGFNTYGSGNGMGIGCQMRDTSARDRFYNGLVGEIVMFSDELTTEERQKVEGYLAWKWGLQDSLPGGHPYKNERPWV